MLSLIPVRSAAVNVGAQSSERFAARLASAANTPEPVPAPVSPPYGSADAAFRSGEHPRRASVRRASRAVRVLTRERSCPPHAPHRYAPRDHCILTACAADLTVPPQLLDLSDGHAEIPYLAAVPLRALPVRRRSAQPRGQVFRHRYHRLRRPPARRPTTRSAVPALHPRGQQFRLLATLADPVPYPVAHPSPFHQPMARSNAGAGKPTRES